MDYIKVLKKNFGFTVQNKYFKIDGKEELLKFCYQNRLPIWTSEKGRVVLEPCIIRTNRGDFIVGTSELEDLIYLKIKTLMSFNIVRELGDIEILEVKPLNEQDIEQYKDLAYKAKKEKSTRDYRTWSSKWHCVNNFCYCFGWDTVMEKVVYEDIDDLQNTNCTSVYLYRGVEASSEKELAERFHIKKYGSVNHDHTQDMADSYDLLLAD